MVKKRNFKPELVAVDLLLKAKPLKTKKTPYQKGKEQINRKQESYYFKRLKKLALSFASTLIIKLSLAFLRLIK